jgi:hypothetical protein
MLHAAMSACSGAVTLVEQPVVETLLHAHAHV